MNNPLLTLLAAQTTTGGTITSQVSTATSPVNGVTTTDINLQIPTEGDAALHPFVDLLDGLAFLTQQQNTQTAQNVATNEFVTALTEQAKQLTPGQLDSDTLNALIQQTAQNTQAGDDALDIIASLLAGKTAGGEAPVIDPLLAPVNAAVDPTQVVAQTTQAVVATPEQIKQNTNPQQTAQNVVNNVATAQVVQAATTQNTVAAQQPVAEAEVVMQAVQPTSSQNVAAQQSTPQPLQTTHQPDASRPASDNSARAKLLNEFNASVSKQVETVSQEAVTQSKGIQAYQQQPNAQVGNPNITLQQAFGLTETPAAPQGDTSFNPNIASVEQNSKAIETSGTTAQSRPAAPSHHATPAEQVSVRIAQAVQNNDSKITINLKPAELGNIEVKMDMAEGRTTVAVMADKAETLDMLRSDARSLQQALKSAGIDMDMNQMNFGLKGEQGQDNKSFAQNQDGNENRVNAQQEDNVETVDPAVIAQHMVDQLSQGHLDIRI